MYTLIRIHLIPLMALLKVVRGSSDGDPMTWNCWDTKCQKEPTDGSLPIRPGYFPMNYAKESPYVAGFTAKNDDVYFCLGIVINKDRVLTTMTCVHDDGWVLRPVSSFDIRHGGNVVSSTSRYEVEEIRLHPRCKSLGKADVFWESCDFALVRSSKYLRNFFSAIFPHKDPDVAKDVIENSKSFNKLCIGVGLGRYEVWSKGSSGWSGTMEGSAKKELYKFDLRLISTETCNLDVVNCCISNPFESVWYSYKKYFTKTSCAARGKKRSQCFGETGGPIICDGWVYGLMKGIHSCEIERNKNSDLHGAMLYVTINNALTFIRYDYLQTSNNDERPVPDLNNFDVVVDGDGTPLGPGSRPGTPQNSSETKSGSGSGSGDDTDDYYYGNGMRLEILNSLIFTIAIFTTV